MSAIIIQELMLIALNIMVFILSHELNKNYKEFKQENEVLSILSIIQEVISIIYITIFGIHSLYFKIYRRLLCFIIVSIIMIVFYLALFITSFIYELMNHFPSENDLENIYNYKKIIMIICLTKSVFYLSAIFITLKERRNLVQEIEESPYKMVDEEFTEEMYKNIMDHSINPGNKNAKEEFSKNTLIVKEKQKSIKSANTSMDSKIIIG